MGPTGCPKISARNYHYTLRSSPAERSPHLLRGWSPKSRLAESSSHSIEPFEFVVGTSVMCAHIALNWLWKLSPRIPPTRRLHCPRRGSPWPYPHKSAPWISSCVAATDDVIPLIEFSSVGLNDEPRSHNFWKKSISAFATALEKFCTGVFLPPPQAVLYSKESISALPVANFSVAKFSANGRNCRFTIPTAAQISLMMWQSPRISASTLTFVSVVANVAAKPVTYVLFTALKTTDPASNWRNTYGIFIIHAIQASMNLSIGLETSAVRNSFTILCIVPKTITPTILHY